MENFLLPRMTVRGINIDVPYVYNTGSAKDVIDMTKKEMVVLENSPARFVNVEENAWRFEGLGKETCINTQPALLIAVWKRMLFFLFLLNNSIHQHTDIGCRTFF